MWRTTLPACLARFDANVAAGGANRQRSIPAAHHPVQVAPPAFGRFELELDIDQFYTLRITKQGQQEKMLYFDTKLPPDLVKYPDYECYVNLQAPLADGTDPFYTDFPSAIVRYNEVMGGFYHSEHYLSHIQTRLAGVSSATF